MSAAGVQAATSHDATPERASTGVLTLGPLTEQVLDELRSSPLVVTPLDSPVVGPRGTLAPVRLRLSAGTLPERSAAAYLFASRTVHAVAPECRVSPYLLAAIGRSTSDHGRWEAPAQQGRRSAAVPDTDGGTLDGDRRADHGVGPMRLLPAMWTAAGVDADGDGTRDPRDLDDAALGAAVYLCAAARSGHSAARVDRALLSWNADPSFPRQVRRLATSYAGPAFAPVWAAARVVPSYAGSVTPSAVAVSLPADETPSRPDSTVRPTGTSRPTGTTGSTGGRPGSGTGTPTGSPTGSPSGTPAGPPPSPSEPSPPQPTPSDPGTPGPTQPSGPTEDSHSLSGRLTWDDDVWSVGGTPVDAGSQSAQLRDAAADHDRDETVESNLDELTGLLGTNVVVEVDASGHVLMIGTDPYSG